MELLSLCTGYGGLDMAVGALTGAHLVGVADNDPHVSTIIAERYGDVPNYGDVRMLDHEAIGAVDIITAGYPCQPFSTAGKRKGKDDPRHLWPDIAEAIRVLRPRLVCLENVAGHLSLGFGAVLGDLAAARYDVRWTCVRASDVGAPHRRDRVFIVAADAGGNGREGTEAPRVAGSSTDGTTATAWRRIASGRHSAAADADGNRREGLAQSDCPAHAREDSQYRHDPDGLGSASSWGKYAAAIRRWEQLTRPAPPPLTDWGQLCARFVEWLMGLSDGWVTSCPLPRTQQLRVLGQGVVPQQALLALEVLGLGETDA